MEASLKIGSDPISLIDLIFFLSIVSTLIIRHIIQQGSVLNHLLFLNVINNLNIAIKHAETIHFVDDTYLLNAKDSVKQMNKASKKDLKFLVQWLHANMISPNVAKTEVIIYKRKKQQLVWDQSLKLCG